MAKRIFVAGHKGMVGRALVRRLEQDGENEVFGRSHRELDLMDQRAVRAFFEREHIDKVYFAAASRCHELRPDRDTACQSSGGWL